MTSSCRFESPIRHNRSTGPAAQLHMHVDTGTIKIFVAWLAITVGWFPHELAVSDEAAFSHVYRSHSTQLCTRPSVGPAAGRTWLRLA